MKHDVPLSELVLDDLRQIAKRDGITITTVIQQLIADGLGRNLHQVQPKQGEWVAQDRERVLEWLALCPRGVHLTARSALLYQEYRNWAVSRQFVPLDNKQLRSILVDTGLENVKRSSGQFWIGIGLPDPSAQDQKRTDDIVSDFIEARCFVGEVFYEKWVKLYSEYGAWSVDQKLAPISQAIFQEKLIKRGHEIIVRSKEKIIRGIGLQGNDVDPATVRRYGSDVP